MPGARAGDELSQERRLGRTVSYRCRKQLQWVHGCMHARRTIAKAREECMRKESQLGTLRDSQPWDAGGHTRDGKVVRHPGLLPAC